MVLLVWDKPILVPDVDATQNQCLWKVPGLRLCHFLSSITWVYALRLVLKLILSCLRPCKGREALLLCSFPFCSNTLIIQLIYRTWAFSHKRDSYTCLNDPVTPVKSYISSQRVHASQIFSQKFVITQTVPINMNAITQVATNISQCPSVQHATK